MYIIFILTITRNDRLWCFFSHSESKVKPEMIVCGVDGFNLLGENPNKKSEFGDPIISPPLKSSFDLPSLLSYSVYNEHSTVVTKSGPLLGIGKNSIGFISSSLKKEKISLFTEFSIKDKKGPSSHSSPAVCCGFSTLYMFSKVDRRGRQLVYGDRKINEGEPVSLFGGQSHAAAISNRSEVIFINRDAVAFTPDSYIEAFSLPHGEKASSIACLNAFVFVSSSNGRVFSSSIIRRSRELYFSAVSELDDEEKVCISGIFQRCLEVSKESGQLGLGEEIKRFSSFTEISSLDEYDIRAAYDGDDHSLFETREGTILSCGNNKLGQLILSSLSRENVYSPTETTIAGSSTFCITANCMSAVFIGRKPPPNTPNISNYTIKHK